MKRSVDRLVVVMAACLISTGCTAGSASAPPPVAAPPAPSSTPTGPQKFNAASMTCTPGRAAELPGQWRTSAPRSTVARGSAVELGLALRTTSPSAGSGTASAPPATKLTVSIRSPGGMTYSAKSSLKPPAWAKVSFPASFKGASTSYGKGTYTVTWKSGKKFISCDGFVAK